MALSSGTRLGSHDSVAPIGAGGRGGVYKARNIKLGSVFAIKGASEALAREQRALDPVRREARLQASVIHPNIAFIFDLQESDGLRFLILKYVSGETLVTLVKATTEHPHWARKVETVL